MTAAKSKRLRWAATLLAVLLVGPVLFVGCDEVPNDAAVLTAEDIDFPALQRENPHICGWVQIDGILSEPILQHTDDHSYYLSHGPDGRESEGGAVFMDGYSLSDFSDPATVLYGRTAGAFSGLERIYSDPDKMAEHGKITLFLPDEIRCYAVFAAVPYSDAHLLYNYDFSNRFVFNTFISRLMQIRELGAVIDRDGEPDYGDRLLILSTGKRGDESKRYLVVAAEIARPEE